ncbi:hypothetical protein V501_05748 [Pseudogymnoascus sp. VKM F-4519 (FW-2642)]|nr:hypothetical protein V501_05748 [Pseudogymnoascus sp. VKM F-4519 (FW-2642)]
MVMRKTTAARANGAHTCQARKPLSPGSDTNPDLSPPTTSSPRPRHKSSTADPPPPPSETHSYTIVTPAPAPPLPPVPPCHRDRAGERDSAETALETRPPRPHTTHSTARGVSRERDRAGPARGVSSETSSRI